MIASLCMKFHHQKSKIMFHHYRGKMSCYFEIYFSFGFFIIIEEKSHAISQLTRDPFKIMLSMHQNFLIEGFRSPPRPSRCAYLSRFLAFLQGYPDLAQLGGICQMQCGSYVSMYHFFFLAIVLNVV